ncbi:hypothetical protein [Paenibacillus sp. yr247]|uniref:hypothetical protein n=1 Tax=Paenibacillus sp. yr247 TaxID=1761880 RepID=UPI00158780F7|nr:hypothetical protein [Paenibacillus sp. yr247]
MIAPLKALSKKACGDDFLRVSVYADGTGSDIASVLLTSISSNDPDNGLGDGDTTNDIQDAVIGTYDTSFNLRAERSGKGSGRIYTITYTVTCLAGNTTTASTQVVVSSQRRQQQ